MTSYESDPSDWKLYSKFDPHRYTRNLVDEGNGKYNLIVLCWGEGQGSPVHDHANSHCFMKILGGNLKETQFEWPRNGQLGAEEMTPLTEKARQVYSTNDVTYINDTIGLHRVENVSHTDTAVSLHLYSPPITCCQSFDERTGTGHKCKVTFYSTGGIRCTTT